MLGGPLRQSLQELLRAPVQVIRDPLSTRNHPAHERKLARDVNVGDVLVAHSLVVTAQERYRVSGDGAEEHLTRESVTNKSRVHPQKTKRASNHSKAPVRPVSELEA